MKNLLLFKKCFMLMVFIALSITSQAQYTLTDDDVEVTDGVITSCSYDFSTTSIIIPSSLDDQTITGIGSSVFYDKGITSVELPSTLTTIGYRAFRNNSLTAVEIPSTVDSIGTYAFRSNNITSLDLSENSGLTGIWDYAFYDNDISSLSLPSDLKTIGRYAFRKNQLVSLTLPATLDSIGDYAFASNYDDDYNYTLTSADFSACTNLEELGDGVFSNSSSLESVSLPTGLKVIGENCFTYCSSLNTINFPSSMEEIGSSAFYYCTSLSGIDLTNCTSLTKIGEQAFYSCGLSSIDLTSCTSLKQIGANAFDNNSITSFTLPTVSGYEEYGWTDGDENSYEGGDEASNMETSYWVSVPYTLTDDDVEVTNGVITSCSYSFEFTDIIVPSTLDGETITGIGSSVFYDKGITSVVLPTTLTTIGSDAFESNSLTGIDIPSSVDSIGSWAFYSNNLTTLDLSENTGLTGIWNYCFYDNDISSLTLPTSLTTIGSYAFYENQLVSLTLSATVDSIGEYAFAYNYDDNYNYTLTIADLSACTNLEELGEGVFSGSSSLESVSLPTGLKVIGENCFSYCSSLGSIDLTSCISLMNIGEQAFFSSGLSSIDLTSCTSLKQIGTNAFDSNSISSFTLPIVSGYESYGWTDGDGNSYEGGDEISNVETSYWVPVPYTLTDDDVEVSDGVITSCSYDFEFTDIIVPSTLDGETITGIGSSVFYDKGMTSVELPSTLTTIGYMAFRNNSLYKIEIPSTVDSIGTYAFRSNDITSLDLSANTSLTGIWDYAFYNNDISSLILPSSIKTIGSYAFRYNQLVSLTLPATVDSIGYSAFSYNHDDNYNYTLTSVDLSACTNLEELGESVFSDNSSLESVSIPTGLKVIGESCFSYCSSLSSINFPSSLEEVGSSAFYYCSGLSSIDLTNCSNLTQIGDQAFYSCNLSSLDLTSCTSLLYIGENAFFNNTLSSFTLPTLASTESGKAYSWKDASSNYYECGTLVSDLTTSYEAAQYSVYSVTFAITDGGSAVEGASVSVGYYDVLTTDENGQVTFNNVKVDDDIEYTVSTSDGYSESGTVSVVDEDVTVDVAMTTDNPVFTVVDGIITAYSGAGGALEIPETFDSQIITGIGAGVFQDKKITSVEFPNTIDSIGAGAFSDNQLTSFTLPEISNLDSYVWKGTDGSDTYVYNAGDEVSDFDYIYYVSVPYTLTDDDVEVEDGVIVSCSYDFSNTDIIIPSTLDDQTVTGIGSSVFYSVGLTSVQLPSSLETIDSYAFYNNSITTIDLSTCTSLTEIGTYAFAYNYDNTSLSLPASIVTIGKGAFRSNSLTNLDLSECTLLSSIGSYAFYSNSLSSIDFSTCTSLTNIGSYAFYSNSISSLTLPTPSNSDFEYWFDGNNTHYDAETSVSDFETSYTAYIPYTLTDDDVEVEDGIIVSCSYDFTLTNIIIPSTLDDQTVTGIGSDVFEDKGITSVQLPSTLETIDSYAFYGNSISTLDFSTCTSISSIGSYAFYNNSITSVDFSNCTSLVEIEDGAFYSNSLISLDLSSCTSLTEIGTSAFDSNSLTSIDLSSCSTLTEIGNYAFEFNYNNTSLSLPASIVTIGNGAFYNNAITSLDLSTCTSLNYIGLNAFDENSISSFTLPTPSNSDFEYWFDGYDTHYDVESSVSDLTTSYTAYIPYTLTDDDVVVEDGIIISCSYDFTLTNIIIPDVLDDQTVIGIGSWVFYNDGITSVQLPSTLESLDEYAFYYNSLSTIDFSNSTSLTEIGEGAFESNSLTSIDLNSCTILTEIGSYAFESNSLTSIDLSPCTSLTEIGEYAFAYNYDNAGLSLPASIVTIGYKAFYYNSIESLDLSACTQLSSIGDRAFYSCELTSIDFSNCTSLSYIGSRAFYNNSISSFTLPTPTYDGFVNWEDEYESTYDAGTEVSDLDTYYQAVLTNTVTFDVTDEFSVIEGAVININDGCYTTDEEGEASVYLENGTYDYAVIASGYDNYTGSVTIEDGNVTENITMSEIIGDVYSAEFTVVDENNSLIINAIISINDVYYQTDAKGVATVYNLSDGTYSYTITATGCDDYTGSVTISGSDITENITMGGTATGITNANTVEVECKVYPNPATDYIYIESDSEIEKVYLLSSIGAIVKVIDDCNSYNEAIPMNVSECASGIYFVKVMGSNGSVIKKIVIK